MVFDESEVDESSREHMKSEKAVSIASGIALS